MGIIEDFVGQVIYDEAQKKMEKYLEQKSLQKLLLKIIKNESKNVDNALVKRILAIDKEDIKPNLSIDRLEKNLHDVLEMAFPELDNRAWTEFIVKSYKRKAMEEALKLYHLEENIEEIMMKMDGINQTIQSTNHDIKNMKKTVIDIDDKLDKISKKIFEQLGFKDILDYNKKYDSFTIIIDEVFSGIEDILEDIFDDLESKTLVSTIREYEIDYEPRKIEIIFSPPVYQIILKDFIKEFVQLATENDIQISNFILE